MDHDGQAYDVDCAINDDHAAHAGHDDHSDLVIQVYLIFDNTCCVRVVLDKT